MANNRMLLVYKPTGKAVYLGKRYEWGWFDVPDDLQERITELFDASKEYNQDDYELIFETDARFAGYKTDKKGRILKVILKDS